MNRAAMRVCLLGFLQPVLASTAPAQDALPIGEVIKGEITDRDPAVITATLDASYASAPTVGRGFTLVVEESGPYTIELRSWHFDAYLVLRDTEGTVLAEDDDGLMGTHARVVADLPVGKMLIEACALHGKRGAYELVLRRGAPEMLTPVEELELQIDDERHRVAAIEELHGPDSDRVGVALLELGHRIYEAGRYEETRVLWERGLAIFEKTLGPEHDDTVATVNNLAALLYLLGDYDAARPLYERALAAREKTLGPDHPYTANVLNNLGVMLVELGEFEAARRLHERALAIREREFGLEDLVTAESLVNLGAVDDAQGNFAVAITLYERALEIQERLLGPEHRLTASSLGSLAGSLMDMGDFEAALPLYERSLAIRERVLGHEHPQLVTGLGNLARVHEELGDYEESVALFERALALSERVLGPGHPDTASCLRALAAVLLQQGNLERARPLFERALAINEEVFGSEHAETAAAMNSLAALLREQGHLGAARGYIAQALAIDERVLGPEHPTTASTLLNLATVLSDLGDYATARPLYERSLAIRERTLGPEHPDTAASLDHLASHLADLGDFEAARAYAERSLAIREKILGPEHVDTAIGLNNLAGHLADLGQDMEARRCYERALAIYEKTLGVKHRHTATTLINLGGVLRDSGDLPSARRYYERALAVCEKVLGPEHPLTAICLNNMAVQFAAEGDLAAARRLFERVLAIHEKNLGTAHPDTIKCMRSLALLMLDAGEIDGARELLKRTSSGRRAHLQQVMGSLSEGESYAYLAGLRYQLNLELSMAVTDDPEVLASAYAGLLDWKGRIARALIASREQLARQLSDEQRDLVARLRIQQRKLSRALSSAGSPASAERLALVRDARNALELELRRTLEESETDDAVTFADLRAALPQRSAVVDLFVQPIYRLPTREDGEPVGSGTWDTDRVVAWITRPDRDALVRVDLALAAAVEAASRAFLENLVARRGAVASEVEGSDAAQELRRLLWDPLAVHLEGVETLFISPDTFLGTLPLETLTLPDGSFLIEHFGFVYVQDVTSLVTMPAEPRPNYKSLLAMGAVDFRRRAEWVDGPEAEESRTISAVASPSRGSFTDYWGRLPATEYESQVVTDMHEDAFGDGGERLLLQRADPTEDRLKYELARHSVLHLATHGFFQPEGTPSMWESALNERGKRELRLGAEAARLVGRHPGLLSGLVCAGANLSTDEEGEDGYLTAEEVGWLDLTHVELVVLSACETGLGRAKSGEGLIGLRRAFRVAGAKTVISSLWSVKDDSTAELMQGFYKNLFLKGMGRYEALRSAQLAMLQRNRMEHGEALPSTWGAFVLSGEWR